MPAGKRARRVCATSTTFHLPAIPVGYQNRVSRVSPKSLQRDHDKYRKMQSSPDEAIRNLGVQDVGLEELLEKKFSWG